MKYKKSTIDYAIYIKIFSGGTVSYTTFSIYDVLNTTTDETEFPELRRFFEESFEGKVQEGYVLKYLNFLTCQCPIGFRDDYTDHII